LTSGSSQPIIVAGKKEATGDWQQMDESSAHRIIPDAGTVYFPNGVAFIDNPAIIITPDFNTYSIRIGENTYSYLDFLELPDIPDGFPVIPQVTETISSDDGKIIGFRYKILVYQDNLSSVGDYSEVFPISWMAYGYEAE